MRPVREASRPPPPADARPHHQPAALGVPVELGTNIVNLRSDGERDSIVTLTAKTVPIPIGPSGFGLAIAGAVIYDSAHHTGNGVIINVPVSFDFRTNLRVNVNFGAQYNDGDPRGLFATAGAGASWNFVPRWSVISEVFAVIGPGQSKPRFQSGVRYSPDKDIDCDLIYGRNLTGEGANWITLALSGSLVLNFDDFQFGQSGGGVA